MQYATSDLAAGVVNRAVAGVDYMATSGTLTFHAGSAASRKFTVPLLNDTVSEPNEHFLVTLSDISPAPIAENDPIIGAPTPVIFTITNDDV